MRILVTGATGFVGRPLVKYLAGQGHEVTAIVRNSADHVEGASFHAVVPDIAKADWRTAITDIDTVVHLAARVHQMNDTSSDPLAEFRKINRDATVALAAAAAVAGVKRFVFFSSVKAAVDETGPEGIDEATRAAPASPYGISKLEAENVLLAMPGLESVILRPPLIYGPGVKANFRLLVKLARLPLPLPLGALDNRRSMLGLTNLIHAIELVLTADNVVGRVFYLDDGAAVSTTQLIRSLAHAMGRKETLVPVPAGWLRWIARLAGQKDKIDRMTESLVVSNAAFRAATGWQPEPMAAELERLVSSLYP